MMTSEEPTPSNFDPAKMNAESRQQMATHIGYASSDFSWFGKSVPEFMVIECHMCQSRMNIPRDRIFKAGYTPPENCPECKRRAVTIFDGEQWKNYIKYQLWNYTFFLDQFGTPHATYQTKNGVQIFPVRSEEMRALASIVSKNRSAIDAFLTCSEGLAHRAGIRHRLETRFVTNGTGIYVDLCDSDWKAIKIDTDGWHVVDTPPIIFRRYQHMKPLIVEPGTKADLDAFIILLNMSSQKDILLYSGYLAALFVPDIDHPILMPVGPQGSAKTTLTVATRLIADPSELTTMNLVDDEAQLPQLLMHHYIPAFDNCGYISQEISDVLCRACTGAGFTKRKLYTDDDDVVYTLRRPILINGIAPPSMSPDFIDRSILISLDRIEDKYRQEKKIIEQKRDDLLPKVRGYLLGVVSDALRRGPTPATTGLPRLADFSRIADSCCVAMGYEPGVFIKTYMEANKEIAEQAIESDPIISVLMEFLVTCPNKDFVGTASELFRTLEARAGQMIKTKQWPSSPNRLSEALCGRLKPGMQQIGYSVFRKKETGGVRHLHIEHFSDTLKTSS